MAPPWYSWTPKSTNPKPALTSFYARVTFLLFLKPTAAAAKSLQSCPTLCNPIDGSPPDFPTPGILQARTLEWVAISFSSAWKWKVKVKSLGLARLLATPWTAAYQAPLSMGFSRQEYWSGVPSPSPSQRAVCYCSVKITSIITQHFGYTHALVNEEGWISIFITALFVEAVSL